MNSVSPLGSYDIVGDIAIIRVHGERVENSGEVGSAIMDVHRNVRTVLAQTDAVEGEFRLRKLVLVAGENRTETVYRESGCVFRVDVASCYFSPRLSHERMRIAGLVVDGEVVANMFAGVGSFSIVIAKHSGVEKVFSVDLNPAAFRFMRENVRTNGFFGRIVPILGDAKMVIEERLRGVADRVLMPLPEKALEYLSYALLALKESGGWVHFYDFVHAVKDEDPVEKVRARVVERLDGLDARVEAGAGRVVRSTGPNWYQVVLDIKTRFR